MKKRLLPVCAYLQGEYGVEGYYVGVLVILGKDGVEKIIEITLNEEEQKKMFASSVAAIVKLVEDLIRPGFLPQKYHYQRGQLELIG
ncbi:hypothetical protein E308F_24600 [Moorella sp. E308F]|nr:hypothetical protein [Moorella sp. E308F]GEA16216.1 hypothetical protein E308F_24600 [Moorella sp. E308F]